MKKVLSITGCMLHVCISTVFAEYTLSSQDTVVVQEVIEKVQTKPFHTQEVIIHALKNAQNKNQYSLQKKAVFAAVESGLRQKTTSGDMMATSLEKKEIISSLFGESETADTMSATIHVEGALTSGEDGNFAFKGSLVTDVDVRDAQNPKVRLQLDMSASDDETAMEIDGELRVLDSAGYFLLEKFSFTPDESGMVEVLASLMNVWWTVPLESSSIGDIEDSSLTSIHEAENVRLALLNKNVIPKLIYKGQAQGVSSYMGSVDNKVLVDMLSEIASSQGEVFDTEEMYDSLEGIVLETYFSLDAQKKLSALSVTALVNKEIDTDTVEGTMKFTIDISDTFGPIIAPLNARDMSEAFLAE